MDANRLALLAFVAGAAAGAQPLPVVDKGPLPGDLAVAPAAMSQTAFGVAKGGDQYLVAWTDSRSQAMGGNQSGLDIFGIRLDAAGNPIDPAPFAIATGPGYQQNPKVAWNGQSWLVSFVSQDPTPGYYQENIRGVRVSASGQALDASPILLASNEPFAWIGGQAGQWLVTTCPYHRDGYGTYMAGRRLGDDGLWLDAAPAMIMDWTYYSARTRILAANGEYLVVGADWNTNNAKARRIGLNRQPLAAPFFPPSFDIGTNGSEFFVAWIPDFVTFRGSRMSSGGVLADPAGVVIADILSPGEVDIAHDGTNWWVEFQQAKPMLARVSGSGVVLDPQGVEMPIALPQAGWAYAPRIEPKPEGGVHLFWYDVRGDANVSRLASSAGNVPGPEQVVSTGTSTQRSPDLAEGPAGRVAVAFVSETDAVDRVLVHLLDAAGDPISAEPVEVWAGSDLGRARIAWNGSHYMVIWGSATIRARRMLPDGTFLDPAPIDVMPGFSGDVDALDGEWLVAASRFDTYPQFIDAWARRLDGASGQPLGAAFILGEGYVSSGVRLRNDGHRWIAVYHSHWSHDSSQSDVVYNFLDPFSGLTPPRNPASTSGGSGDPDVAFGGGKYLFVWRNNTLANADNSIVGRLMNPDGSFAGSTFTVAQAAGRQLKPDVAFDGENFTVVFEDQRHQASPFDDRTDLYAVRVSPAGRLLDAAGFPVLRGPHGDGQPSILAANGAAYVASARFTTTPPFDSARIGLTVLGDPILPCPADFNGDGFVDFFDYADFALCFETAQCPAGRTADFNGDGFADFFDYDDYVAAFETGC